VDASEKRANISPANPDTTASIKGPASKNGTLCENIYPFTGQCGKL
jgi:hypothetical protein